MLDTFVIGSTSPLPGSISGVNAVKVTGRSQIDSCWKRLSRSLSTVIPPTAVHAYSNSYDKKANASGVAV